MAVLRDINVSEIRPNQYQPRNQFSEESISQLAQSIAENGLLQPITVRETYTGYQIIAGERRFRACQMLGWQQIPCVLMEADDIQTASLALIENIQREDLSPIEEANGYVSMLQLTGQSQQQLAATLGKTQSNIANKIRLLNLDDAVIEAINKKEITERHGRAMLGLDKARQRKVLKTVLKKDLTVRQTEELIARKPADRSSNPRCFGVSTRLVINSVRSNFNKIKQITPNITLSEEDQDDYYIMTISIKK